MEFLEEIEKLKFILLFSAISQAIDISNGRKESSTIVVTSIAPPSATPVHGTPSSASISPVINNAAAIEIKVFICAIFTLKYFKLLLIMKKKKIRTPPPFS